MLVIASDLHLTDGSLGETLSPGALELFAQRLRELAVAASWRADGSYRPVEQIDIVLLGDIIDAVHSSRWLARPSIRPWGNPSAPEFVDHLTRLTTDILQHNDPALAVLRQLASAGAVTVPPSLPMTGRSTSDEGEPVRVRIHYMVGNRDWFFHLPLAVLTPLRQLIAERLGLANPSDQPFPHDINENEELLLTMRRHKVTARHGDLYDPLSFEGDRDCSSLGDAIVIELIDRFAAEVETGLAHELPASTVVGLREIENVRPLVLVPVWIDGILDRSCPSPALRKRVKMLWDRLADEFLAIDFVRRHDTWNPSELIDGLEGTLKFSKRRSTQWAHAATTWLNKVRGAASDSYYHHAVAEPDFRNRRARHVVFGHTHLTESVPLDASFAEGYVLNQIYFNCGTWRRVHRQTQAAPAEHEFIGADAMTYLAFFQGDERSGRPYETWSGTLGYHPPEITIHRIDPGRPRHATGQPLSSPSLHDLAPHFAALPPQPGAGTRRRL
jgi:UDP-2,3-diacylglucosamine pyrophosphatase LpxH